MDFSKDIDSCGLSRTNIQTSKAPYSALLVNLEMMKTSEMCGVVHKPPGKGML